MKNKSSAANIVRPIIFLIIFLIVASVEHFLLRHPVLDVLAMATLILFIANLLILILGFIKLESHRSKTLITLLASLSRYVGALVILCWGLSILGVDVATIVASVGVIALIVGFGVESLITDVVTGIFILFENQYNVGDIVEVGGFRGTVKEIGIRTTSIIDAGDNIKIINNSEMKNILNRSDNVSRAVSDITIPYETDLESLKKKLPALLEDIKSAHTGVMKAVPQYLGVQELADSAVVLRFVVEVSEKDIFSAKRMLNRDLWLASGSLV